MVAAGFGTGVPSARLPNEIAPVVPYRGYDEYGQGDISAIDDPEAAVKHRTGTGKSSRSGSSVEHNEPLIDEHGDAISTLTPFFHFDLETAVRAAEAGATALASSKPPRTSDVEEYETKQRRV